LATGLFVVLLAPPTAQAQVEVEGHAGFGGGANSWGPEIELVAGGEILSASRFGLSGEVELHGFIIPTGSFDGTFHFARGGKLEPFVQGGLTCSMGGYGDVCNGWNGGGGATYWVGPRRGFRFEFVETVYADRAKHHVARFGVTFRCPTSRC
jgi:hypothetical protein